MTTERWQQIEGVFQAVLESPEDLRASLLAQSCGADLDLRSQVESLLACHGKGENLISVAIQREANQLAEKSIESLVGRQIGSYKLLRLLGRGGMGVVYLATRGGEDFQQQVAVKLIRHGGDTEDVVGRFRAERRILSRLDHPNIARLLDGGATGDGLPYIVMEYVEGAPLTGYCLSNSLSLPERLRLFRSVCLAVHYAHRHLVVHRDLKPQNILVTQGAGEPQVKLLDFGIAKLLGEDSVNTRTGALLLTPDYASPEQIQGKAITTASDIYALGVILYELLAGRRPNDGASPAAITLAISEKEPPPPSQHNRAVKGDLDNIVLMALRKEPERRYATVEQLSEDIRRYLAGLPVIARHDTILYRAAKFVRRNKLATAAVVFAWLALACGLGIAAWQARRAERERDEARQFISKVLMNSFRRLGMVVGSLNAQQDFASASLVYLNRLSAESGNDPSTQFDLAIGYFWVAQIQATRGRMSLGRWEESLETDRRALAIAERLYRANPSDPLQSALMASIHNHISDGYEELGDFREGMEWRKRTTPFIAASSIDAYNRIGAPSLKSGLPAAGEAILMADFGQYRSVLERLHTAYGSSDGPVSIWIRCRAALGMGDIETVRTRLRNYLSHAPNQTYIWRAMDSGARGWLGLIEGHPMHISFGNRQKGIDLLRKSIDEAREILSSDSANQILAASVAHQRTGLAGMLWDSDPEGARILYAKAGEFYQKAMAASPKSRTYRRRAIRLHAEHAEVSRRLGRAEGALDHLNQALAIEKELSEPQTYTRLVEGNLHAGKGERDQALASYQAALKLAVAAVEDRPEDMQLRREQADCFERLAEFHQSAREWREARDWYSKSLTVWRDWAKYGVSSVYNQRRETQAAAALARLGKIH